MDIKAIMLVYKSVIEEPALLIEGQEFLERYLQKDKNFCFKSCQILVSRKVDSTLGPMFRFYQGILLKNILTENWESDAGVKFHQKVKFINLTTFPRIFVGSLSKESLWTKIIWKLCPALYLNFSFMLTILVMDNCRTYWRIWFSRIVDGISAGIITMDGD